MQVIRYGIGLDMAMEKFDACISTIDVEQVVLVKTTQSFANSRCRKGEGFDDYDYNLLIVYLLLQLSNHKRTNFSAFDLADLQGI